MSRSRHEDLDEFAGTLRKWRERHPDLGVALEAYVRKDFREDRGLDGALDAQPVEGEPDGEADHAGS